MLFPTLIPTLIYQKSDRVALPKGDRPREIIYYKLSMNWRTAKRIPSGAQQNYLMGCSDLLGFFPSTDYDKALIVTTPPAKP